MVNYKKTFLGSFYHTNRAIFFSDFARKMIEIDDYVSASIVNYEYPDWVVPKDDTISLLVQFYKDGRGSFIIRKNSGLRNNIGISTYLKRNDIVIPDGKYPLRVLITILDYRKSIIRCRIMLKKNS